MILGRAKGTVQAAAVRRSAFGKKLLIFWVASQTMDQFRSFKKFIDKIDKYGMKSGIVKVIPPPEW